MIAYVVGIVCVLIVIIRIKLSRIHTYWERRGIKGPKPHWLFGNVKNIFTKEYNLRALVLECYHQYPNEKFVGFYQGLTPTLLVRDPEYLKYVFTQDFANFVNRGFKITDGKLSRNIFEEKGDNWRILRQRISPIFTSGKLKQIIPLLNVYVKEYIQYVDKLIEKEALHEIRSINVKFTMKAIISTAFGLEINTFSEEKHEFMIMANKFFEPRHRTLTVILESIKPGLSDKFLKLTDDKITDFFLDLVKQIVKEREGKPKLRNDFMDFMIKMKEEGLVTKNKDGIAALEMTDELMGAQAFIFYMAGFNTSGSTMSFLLHELATNPDIQDRCYEEIKEVMKKYNGELVYESLNELSYLSMAFDEALRKYPISPELHRISEDKYTFPGTNLTIDKGTKVLIPVMGIQKDPKYHHNPEKFDPERFAPENRGNIGEYTYMPFGEGPRICIGLRFARVQSLLSISHFLFRYRVERDERSMKQFKYDPNVITLYSAEGIWLNIKRR